MMKQISVNVAGGDYKIYLDKNCLPSFHEIMPAQLKGQKVIIITDKIVGPLYAGAVKQAATGFFAEINVIEIEGGESAKSLPVFTALCEQILAIGITRQTVLIALGGGIIGDLTGYVAASLLRGIPFIQIPTTLLAQVDSSVGGKTGINSAHGKNLIGAFKQPEAVIINTDWLKTLSPREMRAGYAEIIKYGLLGDKDFYEYLHAHAPEIFVHEPDVLMYVISVSCAMKADIVTRDECETKDIRALLNLGHTFAHAIETLCHYDGRVLHGEAVAIGLICAAKLSAQKNMITASDVLKLETHLKDLGFVNRIRDIPNISNDIEDYLSMMRKDKKVMMDQMVFVLLSNIGAAYVDKAVSTEDVKEVLEWTI